MKKVLSLKAKLILFFFVFQVVVLTVITVMTIQENIAVTSNIFSHQGMVIVEQAAKLVDGDQFERLCNTLDTEDPFYETARRRLLELKSNTSARYLYTMAPISGDTYRFIIDGSSPPEDTESFSPLGSEEDTSDYDSAFRETWKTKQPQRSGLMDQGEWGWMLSVYTPILNSRGDMVGILGVDFDAGELVTTLQTHSIRQIVMSLVFGFAGLGLFLFFLRGTFKRLAQVTRILKEISEGEGNLTTRINTGKMDEIGIMADYVNQTMEKIRHIVVTIKEQTNKLFNIGSELAENMSQTAAAIQEITVNIQNFKNQAIDQSASVEKTTATMEQVTHNIDRMGTSVEMQIESVSQASGAIEEMFANIQSVIQTLVKNTDNVDHLTLSSEEGRTSLQTVAADIQEIARESEGLLQINGVMQTIASQTNLLAMNAAIEAAHAGEAGKGFAVVADEIRKLAESSSDQSKIISGVLKKIKDSIDKIINSTNIVLEKFEFIDSSVQTVSVQEANIRSAMEEQGQGSKQILDAVKNLSMLTQNVKQSSAIIMEGSGQVIKESKNLELVTEEISRGVHDMTAETEQINAAVFRVNEISSQNKEYIDTLAVEISKFKIE
ncbi:MAG: methyl-accepting chemotaxis protein [Spirochaetaceae bacterium]|jgi:methyl-accepting chemotaxis protein|nr:methyl-accepting chemotaxis protein [Spirochaetaceae bacterium]